MVSSSSSSSSLAKSARCAFAVVGIFAAFSYFAIAQEDVYKKTYGGARFAATFFVLTVERGVNVVFALCGIATFGGSGVRTPKGEIFKSGASQMLAMAASNEALRYVSYPTQVLGKSCKMVPVIVGGLVLGGRTFTMAQYAQVAFVTLGVALFNLAADSTKSAGSDSAYGLLLIGLSLVMDAVTGGLQDRVKKTTKALNPRTPNAKPSVYESMLYTNLSGTVVALVLALWTNQLTTGLSACVKHPALARAVLVYALASAVGQNFIYYTITSFDVLVLTTVTTTRKIFSTVYSVFRDPSNKLNPTQWFGCALVFVFLAYDAAMSVLARPKPPAPATSARPARRAAKSIPNPTPATADADATAAVDAHRARAPSSRAAASAPRRRAASRR